MNELKELIKLKDGVIVKINQNNYCESAGCETCGYGSSYISELDIMTTNKVIHIESDEGRIIMWERWTNLTVEELIGRTLTDVNVNKDLNEIEFICDDGSKFLLYHEQDCCECVLIEDISGNIEDLLMNPIIKAEERTNREENDWESETWTFYTFATIKGYVDIRWHGESNGYYSESVDFTFWKEGK